MKYSILSALLMLYVFPSVSVAEDESPYLTNILIDEQDLEDGKHKVCLYSGDEEVVIKINKRCPQVNR